MFTDKFIHLFCGSQKRQEAFKMALNDFNPSYRNTKAIFTKRAGFYVMTSEMSKGDFDSEEGCFKKVGVDIMDSLWKPTMLLSTTIIANNRGMDGQIPPSFSVRVYSAKNLVCDEQIEGEEARVILHSIAEGVSMNLAAYSVFANDPNISPLEEIYYKAALASEEQKKADEYKSPAYVMHLGNVLREALADSFIGQGEPLIVGQEPRVIQKSDQCPDAPKTNGEENSHK